MPRKRILFTCWGGEHNIESPYSNLYCSGDKIAARIIATGLAKKFEVHFHCLSNEKRDFSVKGVQVHHVRNPINAPRTKWNPDQILKFTPLYFQFYVQSIQELIRKHDIDLVMARTVHLSATGALEACRLERKPLITTLAERDFLVFFKNSQFPPSIPAGFSAGEHYINYSDTRMPAFKNFNNEHARLVRNLFGESSALIGLMPHLSDDIKLVTKQASRMVVIPDGVETRFFNSGGADKIRKRYGWTADEIVIACVARTAPYKRQDILIEAFDNIFRTNKNSRLVIAGSGPYLQNLKQLVKRLKLTGRVDLLGFQPYERVRELNAAADIIAAPTDSEGLPLTLLEAMASGKPVVASRVEPYPRIIRDGSNGFLADNTRQAFVQALHRLVLNQKLRQRIGKKARQTAKRFTWISTIRETGAVIQKALRENAN